MGTLNSYTKQCFQIHCLEAGTSKKGGHYATNQLWVVTCAPDS